MGSADELLQIVGDAVREGATDGSTETEGPLDKEGTEVGEVLGRSVVVGPLNGDSLGDVETDGSELGRHDSSFEIDGTTVGYGPLDKEGTEIGKVLGSSVVGGQVDGDSRDRRASRQRTN